MDFKTLISFYEPNSLQLLKTIAAFIRGFLWFDSFHELPLFLHQFVISLQVANTSHVLFWSILSPEPWTPSDLDPSAKSSVRTTLPSARAAPATTGPKVTTQRALNSSTPSSMLSARNPRAVTVSRDSS